MYLVFSIAAGMLGVLGWLFGIWQARRAKVAREQMIAFHKAGLEMKSKVQDAQDEAARWKHAAEAARHNALLEVQNLMNYSGSEAGQHDLSDQ